MFSLSLSFLFFLEKENNQHFKTLDYFVGMKLEEVTYNTRI